MDNAARCPQNHSLGSRRQIVEDAERDRRSSRPAAPDLDRSLRGAWRRRVPGRRVGISRPTLRKWLRRSEAEGAGSLTELSRRPYRSSPAAAARRAGSDCRCHRSRAARPHIASFGCEPEGYGNASPLPPSVTASPRGHTESACRRCGSGNLPHPPGPATMPAGHPLTKAWRRAAARLPSQP